MHKFRLVSVGLLILVCLIVPFAFSQNTDNSQTPKALTPDEFKDKVATMDAATQTKLQTKLDTLLGSKTASASSAPPLPAAEKASTTPVNEGESTSPLPADNSSTTTTTTSPSTPLNLVQ